MIKGNDSSKVHPNFRKDLGMTTEEFMEVIKEGEAELDTALNKEPIQQTLEFKPTSNKEYSDKMKNYLKERNFKLK